MGNLQLIDAGEELQSSAVPLLVHEFKSHGTVDMKKQTEGWGAPSFRISQLSFFFFPPDRQD